MQGHIELQQSLTASSTCDERNRRMCIKRTGTVITKYKSINDFAYCFRLVVSFFFFFHVTNAQPCWVCGREMVSELQLEWKLCKHRFILLLKHQLGKYILIYLDFQSLDRRMLLGHCKHYEEDALDRFQRNLHFWNVMHDGKLTLHILISRDRGAGKRSIRNY